MVRKYSFPRDETGHTLYTYDRMGRLTRTDDSEGNTVSYTYDGDGNLITEECDDGTVRDEAFTCVYEAEDRLKEVYDPEGLVAAYTYDGDGNRVLELSHDTELKGNLNSKDFTTVNAEEAALQEYLGDEERGLYEITRYINDVNREYTQVLMERAGSGALSTAYVYGNERLSIRSTKKESGYYLYDGRGSVTGIVSILGERLESYSYDPSGQAMRATSTNRYQTTFYGYNAESYDPKTGSVYLRARYYNTRTGSFSTKDTYLGDLMEPLSLNRYSYTWGNPVNYQDPSGHELDLTGFSVADMIFLYKILMQAEQKSASDICGETVAYAAGALVEFTHFANSIGAAHSITDTLWDNVFGLTPYAAYYYQGKRDADKWIEKLLKESADLAGSGSDIFSGPCWQAVFAALGILGGNATQAYGTAGGAAVVEGVGAEVAAGSAIGLLVDVIAKLPASVLLMHSKRAGERADTNQKKSETHGSGSNVPVPDEVEASNGLKYKSNPKHTLGGGGPNARIEPDNSLELFEQSIASNEKPTKVRYAYDKITGTLHRFFSDNNGVWHWSGSTNQGANSLRSGDIPIDILRYFGISAKGW